MSFETLTNKENPIFLPDLFDNRDIIVLAENEHGAHYVTINKFLDQFINQINAIFLELPINYQTPIDYYLQTGQIDKQLESLFIGAENEGKNIRGLLTILDKIKATKIKIICFDSSKTKEGDYQTESNYGRYFLKGKSRDEDMFTILQEYKAKNSGKILLINGANHTNLGLHEQSKDITLGQRLNDYYKDKCATILMK